MPRTLNEVGVKRGQLDALAVNCLKGSMAEDKSCSAGDKGAGPGDLGDGCWG
jgi:hypothetical protein